MRIPERRRMLGAAAVLAAAVAWALAPAARAGPPAPVNLLAGNRPAARGLGDVFYVTLPGWTTLDSLYDIRRRPRFGGQPLDWDLGCRRTDVGRWIEADVPELYRRENPDKKPTFRFLYGKQGYGGHISIVMGKWITQKRPEAELEKKLIALALERLEKERSAFPAIAVPLRRDFETLCKANPSTQDRRWMELYARIHTLREATAALAMAETLPASIRRLGELFGDDCAEAEADLLGELERLKGRWKRLGGGSGGKAEDADAQVRAFAKSLLALRRKVWLGSRGLRQFLKAHAVDLRTEWEQQLTALYDELGRREWFRRIADETFRAASLILDGDRDPTDVVLRRTTALLKEVQSLGGADVGGRLAGLAARLGRLQQAAAKVPVEEIDARYALYFALCRLRREIALANPLLDFDRVLFIKRHFMPGEVNFPFFISQGWCEMGGGGLFVLEDAFGARPRIRDVLARSACENGRWKGRNLAGGAFVGPELSFDGRTILFAWTAVPEQHQKYIPGRERPEVWTEYSWEPDRCYHIFRVGVDGSGLRQLTDGPYNDCDPCWLPDGRIAFVSDRRGGFTRSRWWYLPGHTLHAMDADGGNMVRLSDHMNQEWQPSVDHHGMILFTRYDYWDRGYTSGLTAHTSFPDGRDARQLHGNYRGDKGAPGMEGDLRAVPGSNKIIATASPNVFGHTFGALILIDPANPDAAIPRSIADRALFRRLTPEHPIPYIEEDRSSGPVHYGTAWPLSEVFWLCAYDWSSGTYNGVDNNYGLYLMDAFGNKVLLYRDPKISCMSPIPLKPHPTPPVIPALCRPDYPKKGTVAHKEMAAAGLVNVYNSTLSFPPGVKITHLRIWQIPPRTTPIKDRPRTRMGDNSGPRTCLGTVPVEADGSAYFRVPVNTPVFFQALDADGCAVQSMRSSTYFKPGERRFCLGCHEPRTRAPAPRKNYPAAFQRALSDLGPEVEGSHPLTYARLVQPVLDKRCVGCHAADRRGRAPDLSAGDPLRDPDRFHQSARTLWSYVGRQTRAAALHIGQVDRTMPGQFGARESRLYAMLKKDHHGLKLGGDEMRRIIVWLDSTGTMFACDRQIDRQAAGEVVWPVTEPVNDTAVDRNYATGTMNVSGTPWLSAIKDYNGFDRPITDAIHAVEPGTGFRVLVAAEAEGGPPSPLRFRKSEGYPLVAFLDTQNRLRVEQAPAMSNRSRGTYLLLYQTLRNVGKAPSVPITAVEPLHIRFDAAAAKWKRLWPGRQASGGAGRPLPLLVGLAGDEPDSHGFFCCLEWPGPGGYVRFDKDVLSAGVETRGLRLAPGETLVLPVVHLGFFVGGRPEAEIVLRRYLNDRHVLEKAFVRSMMILPASMLDHPIFARARFDRGLLDGGWAFGNCPDAANVCARLPGGRRLDDAAARWSAQDVKQAMQWLAQCKEVAHLLLRDMHRLSSDAGLPAGWDAVEYVGYDRGEAAVFVFAGPRGGKAALRLRGLTGVAQYTVAGRGAGGLGSLSGAALMKQGLPVELGPGEQGLWRIELLKAKR